MKLLIDSHCWLWYFLDPHKLNAKTKDLLEDPQNEVLFSAASSWEIVIKHALGKLTLPTEPDLYITSRLQRFDHQALPITQEHTFQVARLPLHHRDPFDRILVAQAQIEKARLVTADRLLRNYEIEIIWAT